VRAFVASNSQRQLAIAGGADYKGNKQERAFLESLKIAANDRVTFLGHIHDPSHVKELHHHCFAYIHGHQFGGINPSLLKALGFSNCILALNTPFNSEVLSDGHYGIMFDKDVADLTAKMNHLEAHPELAEELRQRAKEPILDRFNWDLIAQQYLDIFEEVREA
jgi:glycosyltransferase involved in cell wall biosynthesis